MHLLSIEGRVVIVPGGGKEKPRRKHPEAGMEQYRDLQDALDFGEVLWDESPNQSPTLIVHAPRDADRW